MSFIKTVWGLFFRLFPCPSPPGLRKIGSPDSNSPVLVTCNFDLTIKRLEKALRGQNLWLLAARSGGINVWCAAGGDEFNTHSVVSAVKTSGIEKKVAHKKLILPPLSGPGVCAADVKKQTGWKVKWGPVRAEDIPEYLENGFRRGEKMKRVTYSLKERLDTALGSLFPFYFLGVILFAVFGRTLLVNYVVTAAAAFVFFMAAIPWIPGGRGLFKALFIDALLAVILLIMETSYQGAAPMRSTIIIAMAMTLIYGTELGGLASNMPSDLDPFLARLGIGAVGNVAFAGTVRTELLNGYRVMTYDHDACNGCRNCVEICPQGVWLMGNDKRAVHAHKDRCTACRACLTQCESGAIRAPVV